MCGHFQVLVLILDRRPLLERPIFRAPASRALKKFAHEFIITSTLLLRLQCIDIHGQLDKTYLQTCTR